MSNIITNEKAPEIIESYAENYYDKFGGDNPFHDNCQKTPASVLFSKLKGNVDNDTLIDKMAYALSLVCDANGYRTMDIMGLCKFICGNDEVFEKIYK